MTWLVLENSKYRHAFKEIGKQRDRGAGIIATSILEEHLMAAIKTRLDGNDNILKKMFNGYGPLSSFAAKIDLGFLLGLYPSRTHRMLHEIREIRNNFAHSPLPMSFRSQRERCARLAFRPGAKRAMTKLFAPILAPGKVKIGLFQSSKNPRTQFMAAVQGLTALLAFQVMIADEKDWTKSPNLAPHPAAMPHVSSLGISGEPQSPHSQSEDQTQNKRANQPQASEG